VTGGRAAPAHAGGREGDADGIRSRRHVVRAARTAGAAALAVLALGLVVALRQPTDSLRTGSGSTAAVAPISTAPPVARVVLSVGGTAMSPVVWQMHAERDRGRNAVLSGYETYVGTVVRLVEAPDPDDVALTQVATGPQLALLRRVFAASAAAGTSRRGRVVAVARLTALRGASATVIGCLDTRAQRSYGPDGRPARTRPTGISVFIVRMRRDDGRWKVYAQAPLSPARCRR
jgi:hypothetical protein